MRWIALASYILTFGALVAHAGVVAKWFGTSGDPQGYESMVAFFYGVPLALAGLVCSGIAFWRGNIRHCAIPLFVSLAPVLCWFAVLLIEFLT
jgi:hypothetical protein